MNVADLDCFSYRNQPHYIHLRLILMRIICMSNADIYLIRRFLIIPYTAIPANAAQANPIYSMPVWRSVELPDAVVPFVRFPVSPMLGVLLGVCCPFVSVTFSLLSALLPFPVSVPALILNTVFSDLTVSLEIPHNCSYSEYRMCYNL